MEATNNCSGIESCGLSGQRLAFSVRTKKAEQLVIFFKETLSESCFLRIQDGWKRLYSHDVPKELVNRTPSQLSGLLQAASLQISQFDNGDCRLSLRLGLKGGMFHRDIVRLNAIEGYQQMIAQVERDFLAIPVTVIDPSTGALVKVAAAVGVGALGAGLGLGAAALLVLATNPAGWAVMGVGVAVGLIGAVIFGACGWLFASKGLDAHNREAEQDKEKLNNIFEKFAEIQIDLDNHDSAGAATKSVQLYQQLRNDGYIKNATNYGFELDNRSFNSLVRHFKKTQRASVLFTAKFLILSVLASMPADFGEGQLPRLRPTGAIINRLEELIDQSGRIADDPIVQSAYFILGDLLYKTQCYDQSINYFGRILPANAEIYQNAQLVITHIRGLQRVI